MTHEQDVKDCEAGLRVSKMMLVEAATNLERAKVAMLRAQIDLDGYTDRLVRLATPQPTPSAAPRTLQCAACGGHNTTAHNGPDGPLTKCVDCTEEIMIPGAQPPTPIAAPGSDDTWPLCVFALCANAHAEGSMHCARHQGIEVRAAENEEATTDRERARQYLIAACGVHLDTIRSSMIAPLAALLADVRRETVEACLRGCDRDVDGVPSWELTRDLAYQRGYIEGRMAALSPSGATKGGSDA